MQEPVVFVAQSAEDAEKGKNKVQYETGQADQQKRDHELHDTHVAAGHDAPVFQRNMVYVLCKRKGAAKRKHQRQYAPEQ